MPKDDVDRLGAVLDRIPTEEEPENAAWLFTQRPPSLPDVDEDEHDWQKHVEALDDVRETTLRSLHKERGLVGIRELCDLSELPGEVGRLVGERHLLSVGEEAQILDEDLVSDLPARRWYARGYVWGRHHKDGIAWAESILKEAEGWAPERRAAFLLGFPVGEEAWKLAESFGEETEALFWAEAVAWAAPEDDYAYAAEKLITYGRSHHAVDLLAHCVHRDVSPDPDLVLRTLELSARTEASGPLDSTFAYDVGKLLDYLADLPSVDERRLAWAELIYVDALRFTRPARFMHRRLETNPSEFSEIVSWVFKPEGDEGREVTDEVRIKAQLGFALLDTWKGIPALRTDGTIDAEALEQWVDEAHQLCVEQKRQTMGEQYIGRALAHAPQRDGPAWPPDEVCRILDRLEFDQVRRGFEIEVYNSRGIVTRGLTDGGVQERALVTRYSKWASEHAARWPRVARTLRRIADEYTAEAEREDVEAQLRQDRGW